MFICCFTGSGIQQTFPNGTSYCCPCPSLQLKCTFSAGATAVLWSFPGTTSIPNGYPGHTIDSTMKDNGMSRLEVYSSEYVKDEYICIAYFPNDVTEENTFTSPGIAGNFQHSSHIHMHVS